MSYIIVVARYNENVEWLHSEMQHCIFYNKGEKLNIPNEILVENVGRESESYLHYIIDHYDNLPDIVIFTQATIANYHEVKQEAEIYGKSIPSENPCLGPEFNVNEDGSFFLSNNYVRNQRLSFKKWFQCNIMDVYPDPFHIYSNGLFAVKKELILKKPLAYYKYLIQFVNHHIDPAEGDFFERSWYYIFS